MRQVARRVLPPGGHVYLYGSRARNEAHADSDWDLLILLDKAQTTATDFDEVAYPFVEAGWEFQANVNPQLYTYGEWSERAVTPYYQNVEQDKVLIE